MALLSGNGKLVPPREVDFPVLYPLCVVREFHSGGKVRFCMGFAVRDGLCDGHLSLRDYADFRWDGRDVMIGERIDHEAQAAA